MKLWTSSSTLAYLCQCLFVPLSFLLNTKPALSSISSLSLLTSSSQPLVFLTLKTSQKLEIKPFQDLTSYSCLHSVFLLPGVIKCLLALLTLFFHFLKALKFGSHPEYPIEKFCLSKSLMTSKALTPTYAFKYFILLIQSATLDTVKLSFFPEKWLSFYQYSSHSLDPLWCPLLLILLIS